MGRRVRLVVLNYNGGSLVVRCIGALAALDRSRPGGEADEVEIVLIDNASTDGSVESVVAAHPEVRLIQAGSNLGFVANNLALQDLAGVDYVGLVNNDAFVDPGWLRPLVDVLDADPGLGAVQSRILFANRFVEVAIDAASEIELRGMRVDGEDRIADLQIASGGQEPRPTEAGMVHPLAQRSSVRAPVGSSVRTETAELLISARRAHRVRLTCGPAEVIASVGPTPTWVPVPLAGETMEVINNVGGVVATDGHGSDRGWLEPDRGQYDEPAEIFAWCGGSVLLRPSFLADVGLFAEGLFLYYEDTDLSWRGRARGWRYAYEPRSVARHVHAASSGTGSTVFRYFNERNRLIVLVRNAPASMAWRAALRHPLSTLSYVRRDILQPLSRAQRPEIGAVRVRLSAYAGFLARLPSALVARRRLRRTATVADAELTRWFVDRG